MASSAAVTDASSTTTATATSEPISSTSSTPDGLSSGAKIGLIIGIVIIGIGLAVMAGWSLYRWYQRRKHKKGALRGPMLPIGPAQVNAEKQYPNASRPTAGGMAATIAHRGDFDWQNISEEGYDDPLKAPLNLNMNSIGPVGFYGKGPLDEREEGDLDGDVHDGSGESSRPEDTSRRPQEPGGPPQRAFSWGDGSQTVADVRPSRRRGGFGDDDEVVGTPLPLYSGIAVPDPDRKPSHASSEHSTGAAELPTNDPIPRRRMTREYELPVHAPGRPAGRSRNVDDQKFLLSDVEMVRLRQAKTQQRAAQLQQQQQQQQHQQYHQYQLRGEASHDRLHGLGHEHQFAEGTSSGEVSPVGSRESVLRPLNPGG
jgi:hypothetical protein